ncbi:sine oculis-binding protein homolog [Scaptodrosophila lebanonensis]|uniref:Sine oculis-binding protein homolog n=1 Tax=Drosophila lebanonensis TaxID=7225 RepID=A0A6J2TF66_DROLE|nr:sine oculis-binding protein homolog [Scaptodrosophila lebanonensis]
MSAKASPSNSRDATASVGPSAAVSVGTPSVVGVQIKKELPSDEIKEFAEHTMNELLGWYGFEGVDRLDLSAKTSRLLQSAAAAAVANQQQHQQQQQLLLERKRTVLARSSRNSLYHNNNNNINSNNNNNNNSARKPINLNCNSTTPSDHDTRSSREDDSKSPHSIGKATAMTVMTGVGATSTTTATTTTMNTEEKIDYNNCCWCHRPIAENAPDYLTSSDGPRYCSESCFTQSRRASFKKAKTCDWCKHVRHAVSYVDFQDGASQLQFCSEKCLNQYKMQIFCNETQAHLDMNPHLRDQAASGDSTSLITPDLWMRNCRSRSASPASTISVSPGPLLSGSINNCHSNIALKRSSPSDTPPNHSKPLISVAPVSKLLAQKSPSHNHSLVAPGIAASTGPQVTRHHHTGSKPGRRKRPHRGPTGSETVASLLQKQQQHHLQQQQPQQPAAPHGRLSASPLQQSLASAGPHSTISHFAGSSVQDLHMSVPPLSPMIDQQQQQPGVPSPVQSLIRPSTNGNASVTTSIPSSYFATPPNGLLHPGAFCARPPLPHGFLPPPPSMLPRGFGPPFGPPPPPPQMPQPLPPQLHEMQSAFGALLGTAPPVTVMVPYPIVIPLPIPIPVPLPVVDFYRAHLKPEERKLFDQERSRTSPSATRTSTVDAPSEEQPLDCTKAKVEDEKQEQEEPEEKLTPKTPPPPSSSSCSSPTTTDSQGAHDAPSHCINVVPEETSPPPAVATSTAVDGAVVAQSPEQESQKVPKLKITRLQTKRTLIQTKESALYPVSVTGTTADNTNNNSSSAAAAAECSRPLRKRKRIIDCDFQKMALKEAERAEGTDNNTEEGGNNHKDDEECNTHNNYAKVKK